MRLSIFLLMCVFNMACVGDVVGVPSGSGTDSGNLKNDADPNGNESGNPDSGTSNPEAGQDVASTCPSAQVCETNCCNNFQLCDGKGTCIVRCTSGTFAGCFGSTPNPYVCSTGFIPVDGCVQQADSGPGADHFCCP